MPIETTIFKLKAERLGTISEITSFLNDIDAVYNSLYAFDFIVLSLPEQIQRNLQTLLEKERLAQNFLKTSRFGKLNYDFQHLYELMEVFYFDGRRLRPPLSDLYLSLDPVSLIPSSERLILSKVNIQSPGFWEFFGALNPLSQLREYLKDRHERTKDRNWRDAQEKRKGDLDILEKENSILNSRIQTLKDLGYSEIEIRQMLTKLVLQPLHILDKYQDIGQIEGEDDDS